MAPKKIYTRAKPDPNPPIIVDNPEKLLKTQKVQKEKNTSCMSRSISLPSKDIKTIDDIPFDLKLSLFKSKSESDLTQTVIDIPRLGTFIPSNSSGISKEDTTFFLDSLITKLQKEILYIKSLKGSDPLDFIIKRKYASFLEKIIPSSSFSNLGEFPASQNIENQSTLLGSYTPFSALFNPFSVSVKSPSYLQAMATKFAPLVLPQQLHDLPHDYGQHVKKFNGEDEVSAQQHLVWLDDYYDI